MSHNWGPHYIVRSQALKSYSGDILLREAFDEDLLRKELEEFGISGPIARIANPWYYRKKNTDTWCTSSDPLRQLGSFGNEQLGIV